MKNNILYVLVGIQGSGKSYLIENNNLIPFTISRDKLRELFLSPVLNNNGNMGLSNAHENEINNIFNSVLDSRLKSGSPLIIDGTNLRQEQFKNYRNIANKYGYHVQYIDFGIKDYDFYIKRNNQREEYKRLREDIIKRSYENRKKLNFNNEDVITPEEFIKNIKQTPSELIEDLSNYNNLVVFGDIHGCYTALNEYFEQNKIDKNTFYVFLGDYVDRGLEDLEMISFINEHIDKENFLFLKGNHEENPTNKNLHKDELFQSIYKKLEEVVYLRYNNQNIICSHGGLSCMPKYPKLLGKAENNKGSGEYSLNIDQIFTENETNWVQIHGHRNYHNLPILASERSINLEGNVEYGENLRIVKFEKGPKLIPEPIYIKNNVYKKGILKMGEIELLMNNDDEEITHQNNLDIINKMKENKDFIREKVSETKPHISAFNFTQKAFYNSKIAFLDQLVCHARGLFVNNETGEIISRGFEKFFNIGELDRSSLENIEKTYTPPFTLYKKENGFFGTVGYDEKSDELILTTKSTVEGDFYNYFHDIFEKQFSDSEKNKLKRYAQKYNINYIFEVNDPINDPHIIKYEEPHLVLLDIVKRDFNFKNVKYKSLVDFSKQFKNLKVKQQYVVFKDYKTFEGFYNSVMNGKNKIDFEGFVVEDANLNKVKIKVPYYASWKFLRGAKNNYIKRLKNFNETKNKKQTIEALKNNFLCSSIDLLKNKKFPELVEKESIDFLNWLVKFEDIDFIQKDIISLRDDFHDSRENNLRLEEKQDSKPNQRKMKI